MHGNWVVARAEDPATPPQVGRIVHLVHAPPAPVAPVLVVGGCGGGGATTTTLGLASQLAQMAPALRPVAVGASPGGSDLALRGADARLLPVSLQAWLAAVTNPTLVRLADVTSRASSGAGLLWCEPGPLPRRLTLASVYERLIGEGLAPIIDGGGALAATALQPLLALPGLRLVIAIPARRDAANRLRVALQWLDTTFGPALIAATTLVVTHQTPGEPAVGQALARHYDGWVRQVIEVPYDQHMAGGLTITHAVLGPDTHRAYISLAREVLPEITALETGPDRGVTRRVG